MMDMGHVKVQQMVLLLPIGSGLPLVSTNAQLFRCGRLTFGNPNRLKTSMEQDQTVPLEWKMDEKKEEKEEDEVLR